MLTDEQIQVIATPEQLLNTNLLLDLCEERPEDQARLAALMAIKAKEFGVQQEFKSVLKAFNKANESLAKEYKRTNAKLRCGVDLDFDANGRPVASIDNFVKVLEGDPRFSGIKFNLLTYSPEKTVNGVAERWTDADDAEMRRYIEKKYGFHSVQKSEDAMRIVLARHEYHPVREIVDGLEWDGVPRISYFLAKWTKCEDTPYTREVSRLIFAGGIHRLYNPGCKFDDMPVLIGTKQGEGKSTLIRWLALADEYFTEVNEFDGQRGIESIEGAWICEVSELLAMTRTKEQEAVKSYLTRLNDRYRMPFDKRVTDHPRQCIFIGTTNKEQFLTDKTGNRRFYPVRVKQSGYELFDNEKQIKADIRQCWAEALELYKAGKLLPYADRSLIDDIRKQQAEATEDDFRVGMIEDYLENKTEICVLELWQEALRMGEYSKPTKKESQEIGLILQSMSGWVKQPYPKKFPVYGNQRWWANEDNSDQIDLDDIIEL